MTLDANALSYPRSVALFGEGRRVAVLGCGFPQRSYIRWLKEQGFFVIGIDGAETAAARSYCDAFVPISFTEVARVVEALAQYQPHAILSGGSDAAMKPWAEIAAQLGLPCHVTPESVKPLTHKWTQKTALLRANVPTAEAYRATDRREFDTAIDVLGLPAVVKPVEGSGQRGVRCVFQSSECDAAWEAASTSSKNLNGVVEVMVERFLEGLEVSADSLTVNGKTIVAAVTERVITAYPDVPGITFAEAYPAPISEEQTREIGDVVARGLSALGFQNGPTYAQLRLTRQGPYIIEIAGRFGGGLDPDVAFFASGWNQFHVAAAVGLGQPVSWDDLRGEHTFPSVIARFLVGPEGKLKQVVGLDEVRAMPGVVSAEIYVQRGQTIRALTQGSHRAGHVLVVGESREQAEERAKVAMSRIQFQVT